MSLCVLSALVGLSIALTGSLSGARAQVDHEEVEIALSLANMLRSARAVISANQDLINDPEIGDKGLTSAAVLENAYERYEAETGQDPRSIDPETRKGRLLAAQIAAITEVLDDNQATLNRKGQGFKGFVPAVFARLVNEQFRANIGAEAEIKVTAPKQLVRNRTALPDSWENEVIEQSLIQPDWPTGEVYTAEAVNKGRDAYRVLIPEYYSAGCLKCHGEPKGEIDLTGYPKEGGALGDLGGVISITLFK
ncbi:MAG: DUF3365 domain-containing protein [Pseudomonadota bacterium]